MTATRSPRRPWPAAGRERRHPHHAPAEHPDDAGQDERRVVNIKVHAKRMTVSSSSTSTVPRGQVSGERARTPIFRPCRNAQYGEEHESGRAEMRHPACEEEPDVGPPAGTPE